MTSNTILLKSKWKLRRCLSCYDMFVNKNECSLISFPVDYVITISVKFYIFFFFTNHIVKQRERDYLPFIFWEDRKNDFHRRLTLFWFLQIQLSFCNFAGYQERMFLITVLIFFSATIAKKFQFKKIFGKIVCSFI